MFDFSSNRQFCHALEPPDYVFVDKAVISIPSCPKEYVLKVVQRIKLIVVIILFCVLIESTD